MKPLRLVLAAVMTTVIAGTAIAADTTKIRAAVLKIGTVNWELDTINATALTQPRALSWRFSPLPITGPPASPLKVEMLTSRLPTGSGLRVNAQRARTMSSFHIPKRSAALL